MGIRQKILFAFILSFGLMAFISLTLLQRKRLELARALATEPRLGAHLLAPRVLQAGADGRPDGPVDELAAVGFSGTLQERVDALELGYRRTLANGSVEAVLFHHDYRRLISSTKGPLDYLSNAPLLVQPVFRSYFSNARTTGVEFAADMAITATLRAQGSYTVLDTQARHYVDPVSDAAGAALESAAPHHWASLHALWSPGGGHEFDLMLRRIGAVRGGVPAYTSVDVRYGWRLGRAFDLAVVGQNLFDNRHLEYASDFFVSQLSYQPRRTYIQGLWRF